MRRTRTTPPKLVFAMCAADRRAQIPDVLYSIAIIYRDSTPRPTQLNNQKLIIRALEVRAQIFIPQKKLLGVVAACSTRSIYGVFNNVDVCWHSTNTL